MAIGNTRVDGVIIEENSGGPHIAAEQIPAGSLQNPANQQPPAYFIPRVKVAVGNVDKDLGDASRLAPLQVNDQREVTESEIERITATQEVRLQMCDSRGRADSRGNLFDRRGAMGERGRAQR